MLTRVALLTLLSINGYLLCFIDISYCGDNDDLV